MDGIYCAVLFLRFAEFDLVKKWEKEVESGCRWRYRDRLRPYQIVTWFWNLNLVKNFLLHKSWLITDGKHGELEGKYEKTLKVNIFIGLFNQLFFVYFSMNSEMVVFSSWDEDINMNQLLGISENLCVYLFK